ncbi:MAG: LysR family transcriptional regulator [Synergistaceae bacterium]|nr:LysR family transcriptional regulator [Synergistaceae bacterium]
MEIKELNYIVAISEEKSISKAAERLFMAQSSLSQFLSRLESELSTKLFVRTSTGVRATEAGRLMIEYAYQQLSEYHRVRDMIQDVDDLNGGRVIMGISTFRGTFLMPPVLNEFRRLYPNIHVIIAEANSMALEQMLIDGTIDIALIIMPAEYLKHDVEFLMHDEICIIAGKNHPVMKFAKPSPEHTKSKIPMYINLHDAIEFEFLLSDYDTILGRESRKIFREHDLIPKVYNEKLSAFFAASMGAAGLGLAFTYYCAKDSYPHGEFLSLGEERTIIDLGVSLAPGRYHSKAAIALMDTMFHVLAD